MGQEILSGQGLYKTYRTDRSEVEALVNVNIEIQKGDFTMIMGPSGSGKTTLLHVLSSLDRADEGEILIEESAIEGLREKELALLRRKKTGFIFQDYNLIPNLSILENLMIAGFLIKQPGKQLKSRALSLLEKLEIADLAHRFPAEVSGGQKQRASIARSLVNDPDILFADEPTGSLNSKSSESLLDILCQLNEEGQTILMVTHDLKSACRGKRIHFLKDGKINDTYNRSPVDTRIPEDHLYKWLAARGW